VNVLFDHNMSFRIAKALQELFGDDHTIIPLSGKFPRNAPDIDWITALSTEGRWTIISGDRRITRNRAEYHAFRSSRLIGFFLSKGLGKAPVIKQTERLLALWPSIETLSSTVAPGAMFELPLRSTRIEQLRL
jgi:PIN like domain